MRKWLITESIVTCLFTEKESWQRDRQQTGHNSNVVNKAHQFYSSFIAGHKIVGNIILKENSIIDNLFAHSPCFLGTTLKRKKKYKVIALKFLGPPVKQVHKKMPWGTPIWTWWWCSSSVSLRSVNFRCLVSPRVSRATR